LGISYFGTGFNEYNTIRKQEKQAKLERQKIEEKRKRLIQYNIEHKEEHYQKGLDLLKEKKYQEAKEMFVKVSSVDKNYKDVMSHIKNINTTLAKIKREKEIATAKDQIFEAGKLLKSNKCLEIALAASKFEQALKILPDSKTAKKYLHQARLNYLKCYEGNSQIQMAIAIKGYRPVKLYVWIKNVSNEVRHANPTYFTLVTTSGRSYSLSSETYGLSSYFDAVDLQPRTETSGIIIFDTWDKPKKLVYSELLGTTISREFPF